MDTHQSNANLLRTTEFYTSMLVALILQFRLVSLYSLVQNLKDPMHC